MRRPRSTSEAKNGLRHGHEGATYGRRRRSSPVQTANDGAGGLPEQAHALQELAADLAAGRITAAEANERTAAIVARLAAAAATSTAEEPQEAPAAAAASSEPATRRGRRPRAPTYLHHKPSDRAFCYVWKDGKRRMVYLGPWQSAASERRFREVVKAHAENRLDELDAQPQTAAERHESTTVEVLVARFLRHAEGFYRTNEWESFRRAAAPLLQLYRDEQAADFGPRKLKQVRELLVLGTGSGRKLKDGKERKPVVLSRTTVNAQVRRIKAMFRWGASEELVPASVVAALDTLDGLRKGRSKAREPRKVKPVKPELVEQTLPHLGRHVRAMVELMSLCGARPSEIAGMRMRDIDRTGAVWTYSPSEHKTGHHGKERTIFLGPRAQEVLRGFLRADPDALLFQPAEAEAEHREQRRAARKSKRWASHKVRYEREKAARPTRKFRERFDVTALNHAVRRVCKRHALPLWTVGQLRHNVATRLRAEHGLEAAKAVLGNRVEVAAKHYAELDRKAAEAAMLALG